MKIKEIGTFVPTGIIFKTGNIPNLDFSKTLSLSETLCKGGVIVFGNNDMNFSVQYENKAELYYIDGDSDDAYEAIYDAQRLKAFKTFDVPEAFDLANQVIKSGKIPSGKQVTVYLNENFRIHSDTTALRIEHHPNDSYEICVHGIGLNTKGFTKGDGILGALKPEA